MSDGFLVRLHTGLRPSLGYVALTDWFPDFTLTDGFLAELALRPYPEDSAMIVWFVTRLAFGLVFPWICCFM